MIIEIKGVEFENKGSHLMLLAIIRQIRLWWPSAEFALTHSAKASPEQRITAAKFRKLNLRKNYIDDLTQIYTIIDYNHSITQNNDTSNMNAEELKKYHEKEFNATLKKSKETTLPKPIDILDGYKNKIQDMLINIHLKPVLDILNSIGFQTKADTKLKLIEINKFTKFIDNIKEEISEVNGAQDIIEEFNNDLINYMEYYKN